MGENSIPRVSRPLFRACQIEVFHGVSSFPRRALDHCIATEKISFSPGFTFARSMTERRETSTSRHSFLDRLSEHDKKKLIIEMMTIQNDGTVEVDITKSDGGAPELLDFRAAEVEHLNMDEKFVQSSQTIPKLKIAMLIVGTRGDMQPFLVIAKSLQEFGHRVRLASRTNFKSFVRSAGVDFLLLGADPRILAAYVSRNKGFIPSGPGEISIQRKQLKVTIESLLPACTEPDLETGLPFRAQAIISNPPAYGHVYVAEALGVPLHIFFTMPWNAGQSMSFLTHWLVCLKELLSYVVVDLLIWWGTRTYINELKKRKLKLAPIAYFCTYSGSISHLPTGYMWSTHLVLKPIDWGSLVDAVGYCFLNLGSKHQPPEEFVK